MCAVSLREVGSGIRPIWRDGHPHAMLAPDESVGIAEKQVLFGYQNNELIIDYSILDIQSPYPLLLFFAF